MPSGSKPIRFIFPYSCSGPWGMLLLSRAAKHAFVGSQVVALLRCGRLRRPLLLLYTLARMRRVQGRPCTWDTRPHVFNASARFQCKSMQNAHFPPWHKHSCRAISRHSAHACALKCPVACHLSRTQHAENDVLCLPWVGHAQAHCPETAQARQATLWSACCRMHAASLNERAWTAGQLGRDADAPHVYGHRKWDTVRQQPCFGAVFLTLQAQKLSSRSARCPKNKIS